MMSPRSLQPTGVYVCAYLCLFLRTRQKPAFRPVVVQRPHRREKGQEPAGLPSAVLVTASYWYNTWYFVRGWIFWDFPPPLYHLDCGCLTIFFGENSKKSKYIKQSVLNIPNLLPFSLMLLYIFTHRHYMSFCSVRQKCNPHLPISVPTKDEMLLTLKHRSEGTPNGVKFYAHGTQYSRNLVINYILNWHFFYFETVFVFGVLLFSLTTKKYYLQRFTKLFPISVIFPILRCMFWPGAALDLQGVYGMHAAHQRLCGPFYVPPQSRLRVWAGMWVAG